MAHQRHFGIGPPTDPKKTEQNTLDVGAPIGSQGLGVRDQKSGLAPNDHKPGVVPLLLIIASDDEEFAPLEGL